MSNNIGNLTVGLGYDLSKLDKDGADAVKTITNQTESMSAEMKRASREGAESFRLIDEALGIHISRPLTRLLTQEFPGFAKALQSVLGAGVIGALGVAGLEFFEKISKSIEHAQKAQEEWAAATDATQKLMADGSEHYAAALETVRAKLAAAQGEPGALRQLEQMRELGKNVDDTRKLVDELAAAMAKEGKAAEEAGSLSTRAWLGVADVPRNIIEGINSIDPFGGAGSKLMKMFNQGDQTAQLKIVFQSMKDNLNDTFRSDATKGTHDALAMVVEDLNRANAALQRMKDTGNTAGTAVADQMVRFLTTTKQWIDSLDQLNAKQKQLQDQDNANAAGKATSGFFGEIGAASAKLTPDTDPLHKLEAEIDAARVKAIADFEEMRKAGASALSMDHALAALDQLEKKFDSVLANAKATAAVVAAAAQLPTKFGAATPAPQFSSTPVSPTLGAGGSVGAQFDVFSKDQTAQLKLAAQAYQDIVTPAQKFSLVQSELNLLLREGLIDQTAYTAAMQKATEEETKGTDQLAKLLEKTNSAAAGMQAFFLQLANGAGKAGSGTFTFDLLNKGLQGFEDETVKALTGGKTQWRGYFEQLDQMALKFMLNKEISGLFKGFAGSSVGKSMGLDKLAGGLGQTPQITAESANTAATVANTAAITAMSASLAGGGAGVSAGSVESLGAGVQQYASGTDYAPGGMSLVGENGPELVNLPTGSSVTPNSMLRGGARDIHINIDAKGGELGVEQKIARAFEQQGPRLVMRAVVEASEAQRRTPH
jgi:hypothetical protein